MTSARAGMAKTNNRHGKGAALHKVRTKNEPAKVVTVDDAGLLDLERLGLVHSYESGPKAKAKGKPAASDPAGDDNKEE